MKTRHSQLLLAIVPIFALILLPACQEKTDGPLADDLRDEALENLVSAHGQDLTPAAWDGALDLLGAATKCELELRNLGKFWGTLQVGEGNRPVVVPMATLPEVTASAGAPVCPWSELEAFPTTVKVPPIRALVPTFSPPSATSD